MAVVTGKEEEEWASKQFLDGKKMHVGKLGPLLGGYEEEREAERVRTIRRREAERLEEIIRCIGSTEVLGEAEPEDRYVHIMSKFCEYPFRTSLFDVARVRGHDVPR